MGLDGLDNIFANRIGGGGDGNSGTRTFEKVLFLHDIAKLSERYSSDIRMNGPEKKNENKKKHKR